MIIKSLSRKSNTGQLVKYIFRYIFQEEKQASTEKQPLILRHNVRSDTIAKIHEEFKDNEKYRLVHRKDSVRLFHCIISFSNKDKDHINDRLLKDFFKKFVSERGVNNLYTGTKHIDKDHIHLHIAISGTQLNGRSSRISKHQLHHIKMELDRFQKEKYPELLHSLPSHGKGKDMIRENILEMVKSSRQSIKQTIIAAIEENLRTASSKDHFLKQLKEQGYETYYRNGKLQGLVFKEKKFRFIRLGYDENKLEQLNLAYQQEKELSSMKELRYHNKKELSKETKDKGEEKVTEKLLMDKEIEMEELSKIRHKQSPEKLLSDTIERKDIDANDQFLKVTDDNSAGDDLMETSSLFNIFLNRLIHEKGGDL